MDGEQGRGRLSSFFIGGVLGASAALAAARRRRPRPTGRRTPQGLEAFEGAPCYREIVEREAMRVAPHESDEPTSGLSRPHGQSRRGR
jgi:hypothetical protein